MYSDSLTPSINMLLPLRTQSNAPTMNIDWSSLISLSFKDDGIQVNVGPIPLIALLVLLIGLLFYWGWRKRKQLPTWEPVKATLKIANLGQVEIVPNYETVKIAYQTWVEIQTRKVGLPFDEDYDVIEEVYNSWYQVFAILRELGKSIPAHRLREDKNTKKLVEIIMRVLNQGLRPHLTKWQAKFRKWYKSASALPENENRSPQEIQKDCPYYGEMVQDLKRVNEEFIDYAEWLRQVAGA
jgi:hypothetical protein